MKLASKPALDEVRFFTLFTLSPLLETDGD